MTEDRFINGASRLKQRIATIRANLNLPSMVNGIGSLLLQRTLRRFDNEQDPDGNRWTPLAEATLERRTKAGYPYSSFNPMLHCSGSLRESIQIIKGKLTEGSMYINTGANLRIGVDRIHAGYYASTMTGGRTVPIADVAQYMQYGVPGHIPARRFLGIGRLDVKAVDSLLRRRGAAAMETL